MLRLEMSLAASQTKQSELAEERTYLDAEKKPRLHAIFTSSSNLRSEIQDLQSR